MNKWLLIFIVLISFITLKVPQIASKNIQKSSAEQINYVLDTCKTNEIIEKLPKGINTMLCSDETDLSGGEKQRIGVARALLRNSNVLLLDEYTSSMDSASSKHLENIVMNIKDKIIIFITRELPPSKQRWLL